MSITFDPFLTLALPIARPFKLLVRYVPNDFFLDPSSDDADAARAKAKIRTFNIPLNKDSAIKDLKGLTAQQAQCAPPSSGTKLMVAKFNS